jgi:hypothetical protein
LKLTANCASMSSSITASSGAARSEACVRKQDIEAPVSVSDFLEDTIHLTERPQVGPSH